MANDLPSQPELEPRQPTLEDLRDLCRELNARGARYVVVGGFAVRAAGYIRETIVIDLIVARDPENEAKVFSALSTLPDNAVRELQPGELLQYNVIRVADEVLVDLMGSAGGVDFAQAASQAEIREVDGVATVRLIQQAAGEMARRRSDPISRCCSAKRRNLGSARGVWGSF